MLPVSQVLCTCSTPGSGWHMAPTWSAQGTHTHSVAHGTHTGWHTAHTHTGWHTCAHGGGTRHTHTGWHLAHTHGGGTHRRAHSTHGMAHRTHTAWHTAHTWHTHTRSAHGTHTQDGTWARTHSTHTHTHGAHTPGRAHSRVCGADVRMLGEASSLEDGKGAPPPRPAPTSVQGVCPQPPECVSAGALCVCGLGVM